MLCWRALPLTIGNLSPLWYRSKKYWLSCPKISLNQDPILCQAPVGNLNLCRTVRYKCQWSGCIRSWKVIKSDLIIHLFEDILFTFIVVAQKDKLKFGNLTLSRAVNYKEQTQRNLWGFGGKWVLKRKFRGKLLVCVYLILFASGSQQVEEVLGPFTC